MKKIFAIGILFCATIFSSLQAQPTSEEAEIQAFTQKYVDDYNNHNIEAIRKMYKEDAVRVEIALDKREGAEEIASYFDQRTIMKGADQIAAYFEEEFRKVQGFNKAWLNLEIKQTKVSWSEAQSAFVASGTYEAKGRNEVYDFDLHQLGEYAHTIIKQEGEWKIEKSVWTSTTRVENSLERRMQAFNQNYMEAYNNGDLEAIRKMYAEDAVHMGIAGYEIEGLDNIAAFFEQGFIKEKVTLDFMIADISWPDPESEAYLVTGTYEIKGKTYVYDIEIHETGNFAHKMIYGENGEWEIAKSVWTTND